MGSNLLNNESVVTLKKSLSTNKYILLLKKHSKANSIAWLGRDC